MLKTPGWAEAFLAAVRDPEADVSMLPEHARVRLKGRLDAPEGCIPSESVGTVVHRYADNKTYEIEFVRPANVVVTLRRDDIELA